MDDASSIERLRSRLEDDPSDEDAYERLVAILCAQEDWHLACSVLSRWSEITPDPQTRKRVLLRIASIAEDRLADLESAHDAYLAAVETDPDCTAAADGVARLRAMRGE